MPERTLPPENENHLDIGIAVYRDDAEADQHYYHHWALVVEESRRAAHIRADVDVIDNQRMHIIHYRDYPSTSSQTGPQGQVQAFIGAARLGTLFDKIMTTGKIHIQNVPELIRVSKQLADAALASGRKLTCQSFVELVVGSTEFERLLVKKSEYKLRLYGQMHDPAPANVYEHAYAYADEELALNPQY